jgi:hypothetical protein
MESFLFCFSLHNLHGLALERFRPDGSVVVSYFTKKCSFEFTSSSCLTMDFPSDSTSCADSEEIDVRRDPSMVTTVVPWGTALESFEKRGSSLQLSRSRWCIG